MIPVLHEVASCPKLGSLPFRGTLEFPDVDTAFTQGFAVSRRKNGTETHNSYVALGGATSTSKSLNAHVLIPIACEAKKFLLLVS